jgi:hypothetical protein
MLASPRDVKQPSNKKRRKTLATGLKMNDMVRRTNCCP